MPVFLDFTPVLSLQTLLDVQEAILAGTEQQQHVNQIPAFFGANGSSLAPLPPGWEKHNHPQGIRTFYRADRRVLTHIDPRLPENLGRLELAFANIYAAFPSELRERNVQIVLSSTEAQFRQSVVHYYLVDYTIREISWVHPVDERAIGLGPYNAMECRRSMLLPHFWTHVDHYPFTAPFNVVEPETLRLKDKLSLGRVPGFEYLIPWTRDECALFLKVLEGSTMGPLHYQVAILGRLNTILSTHEHTLRWDINGNPRLPRRRVNGPAVHVQRREEAAERPQDRSLLLILVYFLLFSICMILDGMLVLRNGWANLEAFILTTLSSLFIFSTTPALNILQYLDARLPAMVARDPWLWPWIIFFASLDFGVYALLLDGAVRIFVNDSGGVNSDRMVQATLELILPPMLTTLALALGRGAQGLPHT